MVVKVIELILHIACFITNVMLATKIKDNVVRTMSAICALLWTVCAALDIYQIILILGL